MASDCKWAIAIHGGAGVINSTDQGALDNAMSGLREALQKGSDVLQAGGNALDAVEAAVVALEDNPCFNAGHGSVYTRGERHELEASIMVSEESRCGAAALLTRVRNPVQLARAVMERTPHTFLSGPPAEEFASQVGLQLVDPGYFATPTRHEHWRKYQQKGEEEDAVQSTQVRRQDEIVQAAAAAGTKQDSETVGAVAVDCRGQLAAATSTGGRTNKWDGRIGDTPIIGAGNYACSLAAVSGTGLGEQFNRHVVAYDVAARMKYGSGTTLQQAAHSVVWEVLQPGDGGVIAVDRDYNIVMDFNSTGMYRGAADWRGRHEVAIFK